MERVRAGVVSEEAPRPPQAGQQAPAADAEASPTRPLMLLTPRPRQDSTNAPSDARSTPVPNWAEAR